MRPMVRLTSKLPQAGILAPARAQPGESAGRGSAALVIALPPGSSAAASRDKTG
jgi:hypothetical protein